MNINTLVIFALATAQSLAAIRTWDGGDFLNTNWTDSSNWSPNGSPLAGDGLVFPAIASAPDKATNNDFPANTDFAGLAFSASDYSVAGNEFDLASGGIVLSYTSGTTTITPVIRLTGAGQSFDTGIDKPQLTTAALNLNGNSLTLDGFGTVKIGGNIVNSVGTPTITKSGAGKAVMGGFNSFPGNISVSVGTLYADGFFAGTGTITVGTSGTLAGNDGGIAKTTTITGILAPGNLSDFTSQLEFSVLGFVASAGTKTLDLDIRGTVAGDTHDRVTISSGGSITLNSATLALDFDTYIPPIGTTFTLINNTSVSAISGTFTGIAQGASVVNGGQLLQFSYTGGTGNDFTATVLDRAPVANAQSVSTNEDVALPVTLSAFDANGQAITYNILSLPNNGTLSGSGANRTYTPNANFNGTDSFTFRATANSLNSNTATVNITVNPVNDTPTLTAISNPAAINEDAGLQSVNLSGIGSGASNESQTLTVTATSDNPALIPNPTVTYTSPNTTGTLNYTPAANANGSAVITVTVNDGQASNNTVTRNLTVTVNPVNDTPTLASISNPAAINEDVGAQTIDLSGIGTGTANESQALTVTATTNNGALITNLVVTYSSPDAIGSLSYTPGANANGSAGITVTVNDSQASNATISRTFTVTVNPVNDVPIFAKGFDQSVNEDSGFQTIPLWASVSDNDAGVTQSLFFLVSNNNNALFAAQPAVSANGTLAFTPAANAHGSATVSLSLTDDATAGGAALTSATQTFTITINPVNDLPVAIGQNVSTDEETPLLITFSGTDIENSPLTYSIVSNPTKGVLSGSGSSRTYTPGLNQTGPDSFTFLANDGTASGTAVTVNITINPVNDPPTISVVADQATSEDGGSINLNVTVSDLDSPISNVVLSSTSTNPSLANVIPFGSASARTVTVVPASNQFGSATITLTVSDGQANSTEDFLLTVAARNDAPVFTKGADLVIAEDAGPQTVIGWASGISPGPSNESTQIVGFEIASNSNPSLFSAAPAVTPDGTLGFTAAAQANGSAQVGVRLRDNGSTAFAGEQNTSAVQNFLITVTAVNDVPVAFPSTEILTVDTPGTITLSASDLENGTLSYFIVSPPAHGSLDISLAPIITYTPAAGYTGSDSFTFKVNDGNAESNVATVDILVTTPATRVWDGGGSDNNWSTPANWDGDTVPVAGSRLRFPSTSARLFNLNNLAVDFPFDLITIDGGGQSVGSSSGLDFGNRISLRTGVLATGVMPSSGVTLNVPVRLLGPVAMVNDSTGLNGNLQLPREIATEGHELRLESRLHEFPNIPGLRVSGQITGAGKVVVDGPGRVLISPNPGFFNGWSGGTLVRRGALEVTGTFALRSPLTVGDVGSTASVQLLSSGCFDGGSITLREGGSLTTSESVNILDLNIEHSSAFLAANFSTPGAKIAFISGNLNFSGAGTIGTSVRFATAADHELRVSTGVNVLISTPVSSTTGARVIKTGSGSLRLLNLSNSQSSGIFLAREGRLGIGGDHPSMSLVLDGGQVGLDFLEGSIVAGITAVSGGVLTIGDLDGFQGNRTKTLAVQGGLALNDQSTLRVPLDANDAGSPGSSKNKTGIVQVSGAVNLNGATLDLLRLSGFLPVAGQKFVLIANDGNDPISGTFAGLAEGQAIQQGNISFRGSYAGGDGNDFAITVEVIPSGLTRTWDGEGNNGSWSNPQNWSGDTLPASGDNLEIPDGALRTSSTMDLPEGITFHHLHISAPDHNIGSGVRFTLTGGISKTSTTFGIVSLGALSLVGNLPVTATGPGQFLFFPTLNTSEIEISSGLGCLVSLATDPPVPVTIRKTGAGSMEFQGSTSGSPVSLIHEQGLLQTRASKGAIRVGGAGLSATLRILSPGGASIVNIDSDVTLMEGGVLTADGGVEFALRRLIFAGGIVDASLPFSSFASIRVRQSIEATVSGIWALPKQVILAEGSGAAVELAVATGATLQFNAALSTDPLGSFAVKSGPGTVRLSANQSVSPLLRMDLTNGTLLAAAGTPSLTPRLLGGVVGGSGTVGNVTSVSGGTVAPGASAGILNTKNLSWNSTTDFAVEIGGTTAGSGHDQLAVTGSVSLGNSALEIQLINGFSPVSADIFTLITNDGTDAISGTFAGLPEGAVFNAAGAEWLISYQGGTGNDVIVTRQAVQTALEAWRQLNFGSSTNSGDAANDFDFDKDGLVNLIEFAFGLDPKSNSAHQIPQAQRVGNELVITFTPPAGVSGITYGAEASDTLVANDWEPVSNTGIAPQRVFRVTIGPEKTKFMRLTVSDP